MPFNPFEKTALSISGGYARLLNQVRNLKANNPAAYKSLGGETFEETLSRGLQHHGTTRTPGFRADLVHYGKKIRSAEAQAARDAVLNAPKDLPADAMEQLRKVETRTDNKLNNYPVFDNLARKWYHMSPTARKWIGRGGMAAGAGAGMYGAYRLGQSTAQPVDYTAPPPADGYASYGMPKMSADIEGSLSRALRGYEHKDISDTDIKDYAEAAKQKVLKDKTYTYGGGGLGGLVGALIGVSLARNLTGAGIGAGVGGGLGAGIGYLARKHDAEKEHEKHHEMGEIARSGRIPSLLRALEIEDVVEKARGTAPGGRLPKIDSPDIERMRHKSEEERLSKGLLSGVMGAGSTALLTKRIGLPTPIWAGGSLAAGGIYGASAMEESKSDLEKQIKTYRDLHERGYGHLAEKYKDEILSR